MSDYVSPQFDSIALVSIDMQRDVLDGGEQEVVGTSDAAEVIADLRDAFRQAGAPIIHIVRLYSADGSNADACRRGLQAALGGPSTTLP